MKALLLAAVGAALFGLAATVTPTAAAPAGPARIAKPDSGVEQVRRRRVKRQRVMRRGGVARSSTGTNVGMPARRVPQTGTGGAGGAGGGGAE